MSNAANGTQTAMIEPAQLGHYSRWIAAWIEAAGSPLPSQASLTVMEQQMVAAVAARVEVFETNQNDLTDLPIGGTTEQMAIAAELQPLLAELTSNGLTDRVMSSGEADLLAAKTWGDRPSLAALRELGRELAELIGAGMSPWTDLGFTPTSYLPSELTVIAQAAQTPVEHLYRQ